MDFVQLMLLVQGDVDGIGTLRLLDAVRTCGRGSI